MKNSCRRTRIHFQLKKATLCNQEKLINCNLKIHHLNKQRGNIIGKKQQAGYFKELCYHACHYILSHCLCGTHNMHSNIQASD
uniref:Uncharacterized protein n=1 Tax=Klebsiella pneumoniae subsp. pneumoniae TaxID=72407 RepID=A0A8F7KSS6_KLEPN|nr:hypothetical protein [Klebsiella pneumoniae subsp. pneumoniae]URH11000.1 hypothetical protein [Klebsiella pneumoniae]